MSVAFVVSPPGLVHISQLAERRVEQVADVVREGERVWVKVLRVEQVGGRMRIGLSMRGVDQATGQERVFSALLSARTGPRSDGGG